MRSVACLSAVVLFAVVALPQVTSAFPTKGLHHSAQQTATVPCGNAAQVNQPAAPCCQQGPGHEWAFGKSFMDQQHRGPFMGFGPQRMWGMHHQHGPWHHPRALRALAALLFLGLLIYGAVNVLLTVLVSLDMARLGRFNGLWIPILLLAGIPGSIIYALFRMGDNLRALQGKV